MTARLVDPSAALNSAHSGAKMSHVTSVVNYNNFKTENIWQRCESVYRLCDITIL